MYPPHMYSSRVRVFVSESGHVICHFASVIFWPISPKHIHIHNRNGEMKIILAAAIIAACRQVKEKVNKSKLIYRVSCHPNGLFTTVPSKLWAVVLSHRILRAGIFFEGRIIIGPI